MRTTKLRFWLAGGVGILAITLVTVRFGLGLGSEARRTNPDCPAVETPRPSGGEKIREDILGGQEARSRVRHRENDADDSGSPAHDPNSQVDELYRQRDLALARLTNGPAGGLQARRTIEVELAHRAQLRALLSSDEVLALEQQRSPISAELKRRQLGFTMSDTEFADAFRTLHEAEEASWKAQLANDPAAAQKAQKDGYDKVRDLLGDERWEKFERGGDPTFQAMHRLAQERGMDEERLDEAYRTVGEAVVRARKLIEDVSLDAKDRVVAVATTEANLNRSLRTTLGDEAWMDLKDRGVDVLAGIREEVADGFLQSGTGEPGVSVGAETAKTGGSPEGAAVPEKQGEAGE